MTTTLFEGRYQASSRVKARHYVLFVALFIILASVLYVGVLPRAAERFAVAQLKPDEGALVMFNGVYASPTGEGANAFGQEVQRRSINGEYIFDFTNVERKTEIHGYTKVAREWLIKSPKIGEEAIYIRHEAFMLLALAIAFAGTVLFTFVLSPKLGLMAALTEREAAHTRSRLILETGLRGDVVDMLTMPERELTRRTEIDGEVTERLREQMFVVWERTLPSAASERAEGSTPEFTTIPQGYEAQCRAYLLERIAERFPSNITQAFSHLKNVQHWRNNRLLVLSAIRLFMSQFFAVRYSNSVNGLAYTGAALLIIAIGLRGLKFIPPAHPSLILAAITVEFSLLILLGITLYFQQEEAGNADSTLSLKKIEGDMHRLAVVVDSGNAEVVERAVRKAVEEYIAGPNVVEKHFVNVITERITMALRA